MAADGGTNQTRPEDVGDLLKRLDLEDEGEADYVWEEEAEAPDIQSKWLAIAKVHTNKGFSPSALYAEMRSAWNPAKQVRWRRIEDNLFTIQLDCLADWNMALLGGPWLFRNQAVMIEEYDGFTNPTTIILSKIVVWARVLKLPDNYLKEGVIKGMCRNMGEISEVQVALPAGYIGAFVRFRVKLDVHKKLIRFVSITRAGKKEWYQIHYEKLPIFCWECGLMGHWYQECGTGEHDASKFGWGDFILATEARGRSAGRGTGPGPGRGRGRNPAGRGFGRGMRPNDTRDHVDADLQQDLDRPGHTSWRFNSTQSLNTNPDMALAIADGSGKDTVMAEDHLLKKRLAADSNTDLQGQEKAPEAMIVYNNQTFDGQVMEQSVLSENIDSQLTPQKSLNRKKYKGVDGVTGTSLFQNDFDSRSAAPLEGDRRAQ